MFLEAEPLPHLICSRPMFIVGVKDAKIGAKRHRISVEIGR
jgi:hypothetical protein